MSLLNVMVAALVVAALFEVLGFTRTRRMVPFAISLLVISAVALAVLYWVPEPVTDRAVFGAADEGGFPVMIAVAAMFVSIGLGIAARYIFDAESGTFDWFALLRPLVISPILLLPLIGALDNGELQPLQLVSLAILSFQNGFFWQKILANVRLDSAGAPSNPVLAQANPGNPD